jgi:hypothetical protein
MDLQVITFDPVTGLASYGITYPPRIITGLDKCVQIVVLELLRDPGRNVFSPNEGVGLRADIGSYNYTYDGDELKLLAVQSVQDAQTEILSRQTPTQGTPNDRLKSLTLLNFAYDASTSEAMLNIQITNEAGDSRNVLV